MEEAGKQFTARIHPGAGHGFLRQHPGRDGANERAVRQAWWKTLAFLEAHLK